MSCSLRSTYLQYGLTDAATAAPAESCASDPAHLCIALLVLLAADSAKGFPKMSYAYAAGLQVGKGKVRKSLVLTRSRPALQEVHMHNKILHARSLGFL